MTNRKKLIDYVKNGGSSFICSPQIGAGAGFDSRLAGKTWLSQTTFEDTKNACSLFDMVPLYNFGLPDLTQLVPGFKWEGRVTELNGGSRKIYDNTFVTPYGNLTTQTIEDELKGGVPMKYAASTEEELQIAEKYIDALLEAADFSPITEQIKMIRTTVGDDEAIDIQWNLQPYELLGFPSTVDNAIFLMEIPKVCVRIMDKLLKLNEKILPAVAEGGADFVFLGGPASEMSSPALFEQFQVPYSKLVTDMAHKEGLLIYSHVCSPIEPMLTMGYYNQMGIDLFETLSEPPVGNVKNIEDAFNKLNSEICTRGNIGLDCLLNEEPEQIKERCFEILTVAKKMGRKHIMAASDYLFYDTRIENVIAMCEAVREFNN